MKTVKKLLSIILSVCMLVCVTTGVSLSANAATSTRDRIITNNVTKIKNYIKSEGFVNGDGDYTLQMSSSNDIVNYYFLMIVDSSTGELTFRLNMEEASTDNLMRIVLLDLSSPTDYTKKVEVHEFEYGNDWSVLGGHAYVNQYYYLSGDAVYYVDYNDNDANVTTAVRNFRNITKFAFDSWNTMLKNKMGLNLGAVGFVNYCGDKWNSGSVTKKATTKATGVMTYTCTICGATKTAAIAKNTFTAKGSKKKIKYATIKKKNITYKRPNVITVKDSKGGVTYAKSKGNKKITVAKNGNITVKKGLKKGTYKVNVNVTAAGNSKYAKETKTVTITIEIK